MKIPLAIPIRGRRRSALGATLLLLSLGCAHHGSTASARAPSPTAAPNATAIPAPLRESRQLVIVTTPDWNSTSGSLVRFAREGGAWQLAAPPIAVVVGRTGMAWGIGFDATGGEGPHKREGDGRSPAGAFPLDTVFGFAPRDSMSWVRLPYVTLAPTSDCVDDTSSTHYNTVVDRAGVPGADWRSAEHMRAIAQYRMGVIVGYNAAPPHPGRGSCIFLHIWGGPASTTAGCTAFDAGELTRLITWLDPRQRPELVQLPKEEYERLRVQWGLPQLPRGSAG